MKKILLLCLFVALASAYIEPITYYLESYLEPEYAYVLGEGEENNNRGFASFRYDASKMQLNYVIAFTNSFYETVTINGPVRCTNQGQNDPRCISNTGPVLFTISKGVSNPPEGTEARQNVIEGSVTLSRGVESMLFAYELYILVTKMSVPIAGEKVGKINNILRGLVYLTDNNQFRATLNFASNDGSYGSSYPKSKSINSAIGSLRWISQYQLDYDIFHNIDGAGRLILQCGSKGEQISTNPKSPVSGRLDYNAEAGKQSLLMSIFSGDCFFFFTSSALPDGDLFARPSTFGTFKAEMSGSKVVPSYASSNYAVSSLYINRGTKVITALIETNCTLGTVSNVTINIGKKGAAGIPYCVLYERPQTTNAPNPDITLVTSCVLNETLLTHLEDELLYISISTDGSVAAGSEELRGQIVSNLEKNSFKTEISKSGSGGGLSEGAKIGLGVGLGVGLGLIIAGVIIAIFVVKK